MKYPTCCPNLAKLAKYLPRADGNDGVVERRAQGLAAQLGFKRTKRGYNVAACRKLCLQWYKKSIGGDELREDKRRKEVERLDVLIERDTEILEQERINTLKAKNAVVTIDVHTREMLKLCDMLVAGLQALEQRVGSETRDARVTAIVAEQCVRLRRELSEKAGKAGAE
jgi:hypothetical protein